MRWALLGCLSLIAPAAQAETGPSGSEVAASTQAAQAVSASSTTVSTAAAAVPVDIPPSAAVEVSSAAGTDGALHLASFRQTGFIVTMPILDPFERMLQLSGTSVMLLGAHWTFPP